MDTLTPWAILNISPVMPVVSIENVDDAVPLAQALLDGGIRVIEVTLRTGAALESIRCISDQVPEMCVGAGTVTLPRHLEQVASVGARFALSPGVTPALLAESAHVALPFVPGVATASEIMTVLDAGLHVMKFFPATAAGGMAMLKAFEGPFPQVQFCPTGGISLSTAADFLALTNVACVGGSWLTPRQTLRNKDWPAITRLAREALQTLHV